jgi:hypothetical protein
MESGDSSTQVPASAGGRRGRTLAGTGGGFGGRILALLVMLLAAAVVAPAQAAFYHQSFEEISPSTGLPPGWSVIPSWNQPWVLTAADSTIYGAAPPSLRLTLPLVTLSYDVRSPFIPLENVNGEYTLEVALRCEEPDFVFRVEAIVCDLNGGWLEEIPLIAVTAQDDRGFRVYRAPIYHKDTDRPGKCFLLFGLPYAKQLRGGRIWIDDLEVRSGHEAGALDLYLVPQVVAAGEPVEVHATCGRGNVSLRVYREGAARTEVLGPLEITDLAEQPVPQDASENGCRWPVSTLLATQTDWDTGVYIISLDDGDRTAEAMLVVRGKGTEGPVLVVIPTHTDQAYNLWGGRSFYSHPRAWRISFERPTFYGVPGFYAMPVHLIRWLEREGIGYGVATDDDLHAHPELLFSYRGVILAGHPEYWTRAMKENLESYAAYGGSILCLSGNNCWWQTRLEATAEGSRQIVCYKSDSGQDPYRKIDPSLVTTRWDLPPVDEPPERFLGLSYLYGGAVNGNVSSTQRGIYDWLDGHGGYRAYRTGHWVFAGTGLEDGQTFGRGQAIVGVEVDGIPLRWRNGLPEVQPDAKASSAFTILGYAPAFNVIKSDSTGVAVMTLMERGDAFTFNAGTTGWCWGLAADSVVQRITRNLITHLPGHLPSRPGRLVLRLAPNPASSSIVAEVLGSSVPPRIAAFSVDGRRLVDLTLHRRGLGYGRVWWDFRDAHGNLLPSGVYWLSAGTATSPVVHLR